MPGWYIFVVKVTCNSDSVSHRTACIVDIAVYGGSFEWVIGGQRQVKVEYAILVGRIWLRIRASECNVHSRTDKRLTSALIEHFHSNKLSSFGSTVIP